MADAGELGTKVRVALESVTPDGGGTLLSSGRIQELAVDDEGVVSFQFMLQADDPGSLVREARSAVEAVEGVSRAKIDVRLPQSMQSKGGGAQPDRAGPGPRGRAPGSVPAPKPQPDLLPDVKRFVAVSSGKGGVGKSTVAANLAAALADMGQAVGLLDADIYGPDIPLLFGETRRPPVTGDKGKEMILPLEAHGVKLMSLGFLLEDEQPAIMRGPLVSGVLRQFLEQVEWGPLDWMVIDMPPGTGDAQLSLVQTIDIDGALMVTTSQALSTGDVRRAIRMFERVNTRVLGVIENMSGFTCPDCGSQHDIFGSGGGEAMAEDMQLPFMGRVPLDPAVRSAGDLGRPTALSTPDSPAGQAFRDIARRTMESVDSGALV